MKFKSFFYVSALFVSACCMTSCEEGTDDNNDELASIYWNKSAAFQMQLKGNVDSLITEDGFIYTFNQSGNITKCIGQNYLTEFEYSNGRLIREINTTQTWGDEIQKDTNSYTYGTSGKYLPLFENIESGLYRNIAGYKTRFRKANYVQRGDSMLMIISYEDHYNITNRIEREAPDTASLTFNSGSLPVTLRTPYSTYNMTYASDGRFLTIEEVSDNFYDGEMIDLTTFKSNSNYLLPISRVRTLNNQSVTIRAYTYNEYDDVLTEEAVDYQIRYSDYQYDSKGNWISRHRESRYTFSDNPDWTDDGTQTRTITYRE